MLAVALGSAVSVLAYALVRIAEIAMFPVENPLAMVASSAARLVWRVTIAVYLGGMAAIGGFALATRSLVACARLTKHAVLAASLALSMVALVWP